MSFFTFFLKCLYNRQAILASRFRPSIHVIGHICFTIVIALLPYCLYLTFTISSGFNHVNNALSHQEIEFSIENQQLQTDMDSIPYHLETNDSFQLILDPNSQLTTEAISGNGLLMQGEYASLHFNNLDQRVTYSLLGEESKSKIEILEQLDSIQSFLPILFIIMSLMIISVMIGSAFLGTSILAMVASLFFRQNSSIHFIQLWKIAAHTMPLPVILYAWIVVFLNDLPILFLFITLTSLYLYLLFKLPRKKKSRKTA
ncbi:DUF1189 family protein [Alkalicoccobacillus murimartini]|uniref:DUF1189 domain-containing protein n=1 Tax=Alkalicoccobacillus murimartini TaxID=171685 RepID=A0ABT9YCK3_9BACI|nr:DUF1189 family protein [Alkalicoccobacillus murimartini]MDQ0205578.1 hypothetical protein [Alkalicoccobacillus murimartini]